MKPGRVLAASLLAAGLAACASVYGPRPVYTDAMVIRATNETAEQVGSLLKQRLARFAIVSSARDSAWFAGVAASSGLTPTRIGNVGPSSYAFFGPKAIGDTTLSLPVGNGSIRIHDALYEVDKNRRLDLMAVRIEDNVDLRPAAQKLLEYVAKDVMDVAAVLLVIESSSPARSDSAYVQLRALFTDAWECTTAGRSGTAAPSLPLRVLYGPPVRLTCDGAEYLDATNGSLLMHLKLPR